MSQYDPNLRKPRLVFNEYGKPTVDIHESNIYIHHEFIKALKNLSESDIEQYRNRVNLQKQKEKGSST